MENLTALTQHFCPEIAAALGKALPRIPEPVEEIRLRAGRPVMITNYRWEWFIAPDGSPIARPVGAFTVTAEQLARTLAVLCKNSIYARQNEIAAGFVTLTGGHRAGVIGKAVMSGARVENMKEISGINFRVARQIRDCADKVYRHIRTPQSGPGSRPVYNTLIVSPPQCGKTTIIRDLARLIGDTRKVCVIDERSEIAACSGGVPQFDVGLRTDVLDGCPKQEGMNIVIRTMSPDVIITDEIGNEGDRRAVMSALNAGVAIVTTAHGYDISNLRSRREVLDMLEARIFDRLIVLGAENGPGTLNEVYDGQNMRLMYRRAENVS